jgi:hypothetical protein
MNASYKFKYVKIQEIDRLRELHPLVYQLIKNKQYLPVPLNRLKECPDIFDDFPFYFYLELENKIVASVGTIPDILYSGNQIHKWAWTCNFVTDKSCRGRGLGTILWKSATETILQHDIIVAGAYANPITTHICRKIGYSITNRSTRVLLLKTIIPFLEAHVKRKSLIRYMELCYRISLRPLVGLLLDKNLSKKFDITIYSENNDESREKVYHEELIYKTPYHFNDSTKKRNWKLENSFNCKTFYVIDNQTQSTLFYFILKNRYIDHTFAERYTGFKLMTLMDFGFYHLHEKSMRMLVSIVNTLFWESDAHILEIITSDDSLISASKKKGMIKAGRGEIFWYKMPQHIKVQNDSLDISNWHFTHFVTDAFRFK